MSEADTLKEGKEGFEMCAEAEADNRKAGLDDLKFSRLSEQWPDEVKRQRGIDGRPCLTINKLPVFIRQVVNDARQNKPSIKVHPADSKADPSTAEIYDGLIRNIEVSSGADAAYDTAIDSAATNGWGYFRISTDYACEDSFDLDIRIQRVSNPFSVYGDPYSMAADSSDWNTAYVVDMVSREEFKRRWKGAEEVNWDERGYSTLQAPWAEDKKLLIAEWWSREKVPAKLLFLSDETAILESQWKEKQDELMATGVTVSGTRKTSIHKVTHRIMSGAEILETNEWRGKYIPVVPVYGEEVVADGKRYFRSLVRDAIDAQRMFNYWRSATTELVALAPKAPFIGKRGQFKTDQDKWETANTRSWPYIEYDGELPPQRQPFAGVPAGALQEALNASDDMKAIVGLYDASLGARSNETSGRAIMAREREGDVSTFHYIDNLRRAITHGGRILIDLIQKVYTGERIARILGQDNKSSTVQLGRPVPVTDDDGRPAMDEMGQPMTRIYDLAVGKYDLTVTTGPSYTTRREETSNQIIELIRAYPPAAPLIGDILARSLDWPEADEVAKRFERMALGQGGEGGEATAPPLDPVKVMEVQAKSQSDQMNVQLKEMELQIKQFQAVTDRMEAVMRMQEERRQAMTGGMPSPGAMM